MMKKMLSERTARHIRVFYNDGLWSVEEFGKPDGILNFTDCKVAKSIGVQLAVIKNVCCVLHDQSGNISEVFTSFE